MPVLTISAGNGWLTQEERFGQDISGNSLKKYTELPRGGLSYNRGASKAYWYGITYKQDIFEKALVPNVYHSFIPIPNLVDSSFLEKTFLGNLHDRELNKIISSSARRDGLLNINRKDFFNISIKISKSISEQAAIGKFVNRLDQLIALNQRKFKLFQSLKEAFLSIIFKYSLNFKVSNRKKDSKWKKYKLGELTKITTGKLNASANTDNGKFPFITCGKKILKVNTAAFNGPAITIAGNGEVGHSKLLNEPFNAYQRTYVIDHYAGNYIFLKSAIDYFLPRQLHRETAYGVMPYIVIKTLYNLKLPIPDTTTQYEIGNFITLLDETLNYYELKIKILKNLKQFYLNNLFI